MSDTVFYQGKLTPTGMTLEEFYKSRVKGDDEAPYSLKEWIEEEFWDTHYYIKTNDMVYEIEKEDVFYNDLFQAEKREDGTIDFKLKYYDGGCCFSEAMTNALKKIK